MPVVGFFSSISEDTYTLAAFRRGLFQEGYVAFSRGLCRVATHGSSITTRMANTTDCLRSLASWHPTELT